MGKLICSITISSPVCSWKDFLVRKPGMKILEFIGCPLLMNSLQLKGKLVKDVPGGFPKSDLLGVTVALIHVAAQRFLAVIKWP